MAIVVSKPVFQFDLEIPLSDFEAFNSEDVSHLSFMTLSFHTPCVPRGTKEEKEVFESDVTPGEMGVDQVRVYRKTRAGRR